jgi:hypothetical protein
MPVLAIGFLVAAHLFDYVSFLVMTSRHGLGAELNPLVISLATDYGLTGLTLAKLGSVVFLALMVLILAPHRRKAAAALLTVGVFAGVLGGVSNIAST